MRNNEFRRVDDLVVVEDEIEIERARRIGFATDTTELTFDLQTELQEVVWESLGFDGNDSIQEIAGTAWTVEGCGFVLLGAADHAQAWFGSQSPDCGGERLPPVAEIR